MSSNPNSLTTNASSFPTLSTIMEAESDSAVAHALALALDANEGEDLVDNVDNVNALAQEVISIYAAIEAANRADDPFGDQASVRSGASTIRPIRKVDRDDTSTFSYNADRDSAPVPSPHTHGHPHGPAVMGYGHPHPYPPPGYYPPPFPSPYYPYPYPGWGHPAPYWPPPPVAQSAPVAQGPIPAAQAAPPPPPPPAGPVLSSKAQGKAAVKVRVTADNEYVPPLSEDAMKKTFSPTSWLPAAFVPSKGKKSSSKASTSGSGPVSPGPSSSQASSSSVRHSSSGALADLYDVELWVGRLQSLGIEGSHEQLTTIAQNVVQYLFEMLKDIVCI
ncbi:hypothetical protein FA13DRAFT_1717381 [Coprinellus micaceus]|uniref:Uncharacterized protein n=1 Tax=Coprinellus micaceus TaxID=71717 RepID=A0A4Y7SGQ4_COPMI|nr:hypothetical protein FA13DRAFT_1717381 [Coprinellus micaceus]